MVAEKEASKAICKDKEGKLAMFSDIGKGPLAKERKYC